MISFIRYSDIIVRSGLRGKKQSKGSKRSPEHRRPWTKPVKVISPCLVKPVIQLFSDITVSGHGDITHQEPWYHYPQQVNRKKNINTGWVNDKSYLVIASAGKSDITMPGQTGSPEHK